MKLPAILLTLLTATTSLLAQDTWTPTTNDIYNAAQSRVWALVQDGQTNYSIQWDSPNIVSVTPTNITTTANTLPFSTYFYIYAVAQHKIYAATWFQFFGDGTLYQIDPATGSYNSYPFPTGTGMAEDIIPYNNKLLIITTTAQFSLGTGFPGDVYLLTFDPTTGTYEPPITLFSNVDKKQTRCSPDANGLFLCGNGELYYYPWGSTPYLITNLLSLIDTNLYSQKDILSNLPEYTSGPIIQTGDHVTGIIGNCVYTATTNGLSSTNYIVSGIYAPAYSSLIFQNSYVLGIGLNTSNTISVVFKASPTFTQTTLIPGNNRGTVGTIGQANQVIFATWSSTTSFTNTWFSVPIVSTLNPPPTLSYNGFPGETNILQASTNLQTWADVGTIERQTPNLIATTNPTAFFRTRTE